MLTATKKNIEGALLAEFHMFWIICGIHSAHMKIKNKVGKVKILISKNSPPRIDMYNLQLNLKSDILISSAELCVEMKSIFRDFQMWIKVCIWKIFV